MHDKLEQKILSINQEIEKVDRNLRIRLVTESPRASPFRFESLRGFPSRVEFDSLLPQQMLGWRDGQDTIDGFESAGAGGGR